MDALSRLAVQKVRGVGAPHIELPSQAIVDAIYSEHPSLPAINWQAAQDSDPDYCYLRSFLQTGE